MYTCLSNIHIYIYIYTHTHLSIPITPVRAARLRSIEKSRVERSGGFRWSGESHPFESTRPKQEFQQKSNTYEASKKKQTKEAQTSRCVTSAKEVLLSHEPLPREHNFRKKERTLRTEAAVSTKNAAGAAGGAAGGAGGGAAGAGGGAGGAAGGAAGGSSGGAAGGAAGASGAAIQQQRLLSTS